MSDEIPHRTVRVGDDDVTIWDFRNPNSWYSHVYQNSDTKTLDDRFGLTGETVVRGSPLYMDILRATGSCSLGKTEVEFVLRYFAVLATQAGNFIGILEEEIRRHTNGKLSFSDSMIDMALRYQDGMNNGVRYLRKLQVEGKDVLFPAHLQKVFL